MKLATKIADEVLEKVALSPGYVYAHIMRNIAKGGPRRVPTILAAQPTKAEAAQMWNKDMAELGRYAQGVLERNPRAAIKARLADPKGKQSLDVLTRSSRLDGLGEDVLYHRAVKFSPEHFDTVKKMINKQYGRVDRQAKQILDDLKDLKEHNAVVAKLRALPDEPSLMKTLGLTTLGVGGLGAGLYAMEHAARDEADRQEGVGKYAFSVTDEGHEYDAALAELRKNQALERLRFAGKYDAQAAHRLPGGEIKRPNFLNYLRFGLGDELARARHQAYVQKQHEEGSNAWNPFGGLLTPLPEEEGASTGFLSVRGQVK